MEKFSDMVQGIAGMLKEQPWYMNIMIVVGAIVMFLIILAILISSVTITKMVFTVDFAAIGICVYNCYEEGRVDVNAVIAIIVLIIVLVGLFFIICGIDESYTGILTTFFGSLLEGVVNMMILLACATIILIPLASMCWNKNDRYS